MLDAEAIRALVPHAGSMCLLDRVLSWDDAGIVCATAQHRALSNPLRAAGRLSAVHAIEFAAQSMAVHGALVAATQAPAVGGLLLSVRDCRFHCARLDDVTLDIEVSSQRMAGSGRMLMYRFALHAATRCLVEGRASVLLTGASGA